MRRSLPAIFFCDLRGLIGRSVVEDQETPGLFCLRPNAFDRLREKGSAIPHR